MRIVSLRATGRPAGHLREVPGRFVASLRFALLRWEAPTRALAVAIHRWPRSPWSELPARYRTNGAFAFEGGYLEQLRRWALWPKDAPVHPRPAGQLWAERPLG